MKYKIAIQVDDGNQFCELDSFVIEKDIEIFACIGQWAIDYFLAVDKVDMQDARVFNRKDTETPVLRFTTEKENDGETTYHRHGLRRGILLTGRSWSYIGNDKFTQITVSKVED